MYALVRAITVLLLALGRLLYGVRIEGEENIPEHGPFILVSNELSTMGDIFITVTIMHMVLSGRMDAPIGFSDEYSWANEQWAWLLAMGHTVAVPRGPGQAVAAYLSALRGLREGKIVALNPEGEISWDGREVRPKPAAAYVALRSAAPIVPMVTTRGAYDVWPRWAERPRLTGSFVVRVGSPFRVTDTAGSKVSTEAIVRANERIMEEMAALTYD